MSILHMLTIGLCLASTSSILAKPVTQKEGRIEINWSTMKLRFYGEVMPGSTSGVDYNALEKKAWTDGIFTMVRQLPEYRMRNDFYRLENEPELAKEAAQRVARTTYSVNTEYSSDGNMRIHMENSLARALDPGEMEFDREEISNSENYNTSLVFEIEGSPSPTPIYEIVDENGDAVFRVTDVARKAFEKRLMGRWLARPGKAEIVKLGGKNPVSVKLTHEFGTKFIVDREQWDSATDGNQGLLEAANIILVLK